MENDDTVPHEIIPMSYNAQNILNEYLYHIENKSEKRFIVQTRTQGRAAGQSLPKVHGVDKQKCN